ncbi:hypothetical protein Aocu_04450 [Acholeplasma oculi]|uniref:Uncharacterized protein n=2 Tax=Acholeplasma oculi TaxID=35623 RepID=A0A061A9H9_9MOLU|nr:hypothetical protein Aocu_04450 [Acholeplasma oculi]
MLKTIYKENSMDKLKISDVSSNPIDELVKENVIDSELTSNVVIIPDKTYSEKDSVVWTFPEGTEDFYDYLNKHVHLLGAVDIAEGNTGELQQHNDLLELATIVISTPAISILINVVSSYIYDYLKIKKKPADKVDVKLKIVKKGKTKTTELEFNGTAEDFEKIMGSINDKDYD